MLKDRIQLPISWNAPSSCTYMRSMVGHLMVMIETNNHTSDVVCTSSAIGFFCEFVGSLRSVFNGLYHRHCFLVCHHIPQSITGQNQKINSLLYYVLLNLWLCNHISLQQPVTKCTGYCKDTSYSPSANPHYNTSCILNALPLIGSVWLVIRWQSKCFTTSANHSPWITNIGNKQTVPHQDSCRSCWPSIPVLTALCS